MRRRNTLDPFTAFHSMGVTVTDIQLRVDFDGGFRIIIEAECPELAERLLPPKQWKPRGGYRQTGTWKAPADLDFTGFHVPAEW